MPSAISRGLRCSCGTPPRSLTLSCACLEFAQVASSCAPKLGCSPLYGQPLRWKMIGGAIIPMKDCGKIPPQSTNPHTVSHKPYKPRYFQRLRSIAVLTESAPRATSQRPASHLALRDTWRNLVPEEDGCSALPTLEVRFQCVEGFKALQAVIKE